jgi:AraC-like DNA-binding protein
MTHSAEHSPSLEDVFFPISLLDLGEKFHERRSRDVKALYRRCKLSEDQISRTKSHFTGWQFREMFRCCKEIALPSQPLSVQLGEFVPITVPGGMFGLASFTARTVQQALEVMVDYSHTVMPAYHFERLNVGSQCHIVMRPALDFGDVQHELDESVSGYFLNLRHFAYLPLPAPQVHLTHEPLGDVNSYEDFYQAKYFFSKKIIEIIFDKHHLTQPLLTHNQATFEQVYSFLQNTNPSSPSSFTTKVQNIVRQRFSTGQPVQITQIADQMKISERTLARHLQQENSSFIDIKQKVAIEYAKLLLETTDQSVRKIAHACGYNSDSNFSRAFKCYTGKTPMQFRSSQ